MKVNRVLRGILLAISVVAMAALSVGSSVLAVSGGGTFPR